MLLLGQRPCGPDDLHWRCWWQDFKRGVSRTLKGLRLLKGLLWK